MTIKYTIMMLATLVALLGSGYATGIIREKYGKTHVLNFIPILIAILMINIVFALVEMSRAGRI
ncbi:hypothetical protein [Calidifontibacillus oryziterrae]|uniref:hypothetical protein n=1 Tax=Calidifontibacillus oryziterrae TaxID=1191699 RepID=UPI0003007B0C|nr:hypothetical protein [Calidifontibacillus oryziterrae]